MYFIIEIIIEQTVVLLLYTEIFTKFVYNLICVTKNSAHVTWCNWCLQVLLDTRMGSEVTKGSPGSPVTWIDLKLCRVTPGNVPVALGVLAAS